MLRQGFVAFGANLGEPQAAFARLLLELPKQGLTVVRASSLYRTPPLGPPQPDYLNAVVAVATDQSSEEALASLLAIEEAFGRKRGARWGRGRSTWIY